VASDLKPAYLLVGGDGPKISRAVARLRARIGEDGVATASARDTTGEQAVALCNAMGLFAGGARLVLVDEVERWKAADVKAVAEYLDDPNPDSVLALVGEVKAESPLGKAIGKRGEVLAYNVAKGKLQAWVAEQFTLAGATAAEDARRALIELVGDNPQALSTEVEKLAAWAGGEPIGVRDVERLVPSVAEVPPWDLTDAWGRRDVRGVLAAVEAALDRTGEARSTTLARLVGSLNAHVALVRKCQLFQEQGLSPEQAAVRLGKRSSFPVRKAYAQTSSFTAEELGSAVVRLAELDHAVKGGSRLAPDLELERALVDVTRRATSDAAG
jgi:DNA polymerase-3 subunit delta